MSTENKNNASLLYPAAATLGESPVWHSERQSCFWVDIEGKKIFEYSWTTHAVQSYEMKHRVSLVVPSAQQHLLLALQGGIAQFNPDSGNFSWISDLGVNWETYRCNDGACDSKGRLWIGIMELNEKEKAGSVYCLEKNRSFSQKIGQVSISNGMAWSPDNKRLYYTDSLTREIWSYTFAEETADIKFEKTVIRIPEELGLPDGMAMDEEGMLWVALWGGFGVSRWNVSTGEMTGFIKLPVPQVSSCAFAGDNLDELVITTARKGMDDDQLALYPESGHIFIAKPGVRGLPRFCSGL